jgi:hypothetical protein
VSNLFPKVMSPFKRHTDGPNRNKLDPSAWARDEFEVLAGLDWSWTEKVDGTNIRILWDGYRVEFGGRTDNAQIPAALVTVLRGLFPEELLEQAFGASPAVLHGEGYGAKIQKGGGNYRPDQSFALFDVKVGGWWLKRGDVEDVASKLSLDVVPVVGEYAPATAMAVVAKGLTSQYGDFLAEGLVGRPPAGLLGRDGDRLLMKVKTVDFRKTTAEANGAVR